MVDGFELIGGQEKPDIRVIDYRDTWPEAFHRHRAVIAAALGAVARRIDHVGSTSVPGLSAKPVIDIDVSVDDVEDESSYRPALERAGYHIRVREQGHRQFRTPDRSVNVHLCDTGSEWEREHLLFRDWLRHDASDRAAYARLKQKLATQNWDSVIDYSAAKAELIGEIMERALRWAQAGGWTFPDPTPPA
jgi:GrpB-like predicted nucleotidyltransferase (UPF0157 family)